MLTILDQADGRIQKAKDPLTLKIALLFGFSSEMTCILDNEADDSN